MVFRAEANNTAAVPMTKTEMRIESHSLRRVVKFCGSDIFTEMSFLFNVTESIFFDVSGSWPFNGWLADISRQELYTSSTLILCNGP